MSVGDTVSIEERNALVPGERVFPVLDFAATPGYSSSDRPLTGTWEVQYRGKISANPNMNGLVFLLKRVR